jgi:hypothetical protein
MLHSIDTSYILSYSVTAMLILLPGAPQHHSHRGSIMKIRTIPTGPQSNEHEVPIAIMAFIATRVRSSLLFLTAYIYLCLQHHAS